VKLTLPRMYGNGKAPILRSNNYADYSAPCGLRPMIVNGKVILRRESRGGRAADAASHCHRPHKHPVQESSGCRKSTRPFDYVTEHASSRTRRLGHAPLTWPTGFGGQPGQRLDYPGLLSEYLPRTMALGLFSR
jgi:hypothetical protein